MSQNLGILKSRRFLPLFVTQFLGAFNDNLFKNASSSWSPSAWPRRPASTASSW